MSIFGLVSCLVLIGFFLVITFICVKEIIITE